ncbi:MAG TPA: C25 family cysteine peptidase, partial [Chitinophagales bacterium]|nr:C25 family cysteine peptidase [Chitinophagales bacterium]
MKKVLLLLTLIVTAWTSGFAQTTYGNEWIDPSRPYIRINTSLDALYRLTYADLQVHNFPQVNVDALAMYRNGQQVPIYVSSIDNTFGPGDYIEFLGAENKGEADADLYSNPDDQINPQVSLFSNKAVFFLTVNNLPNNARLKFTNNTLSNLPPKEEYFMYRAEVKYPNTDLMYYEGKYYSVGQTETYKSIYDVGEGYVNKNYFNNPITAILAGIYSQGPPATLRVNYANNSLENHKVYILANNVQVYPAPPATQDVTGFKLNKVEVEIPVSQLLNGVNTLNFVDIGNGVSSRKNVIGSVSIEYPRIYDFGGFQDGIFEIAPSLSNQYIEANNFDDGGTQPLLYDITNGKIYRSIQPPGTSPVKFNLEPSALKRKVVLRADNTLTFRSIQQTDIKRINFTDFTDFNNQAEYYIITHKSLMTDDGNGNYWVEEYRKYRDNVDNPSSGKYNRARIVDVELLYDQFGYGIPKSPLGIRNFINYMAKSNDITNKTKYVFLIGKAREAIAFRDTQYNANATNAYLQCLVPTFGFPGSDNLLAASRESDTLCVAIGRLAAQNVQDVRNYLNKVKQYEEQQNPYDCNQAIPPKLWQKNVLHFSGGTTSSEQFLFRAYTGDYARIASDSLWGATTTSFSKTSNNPIDVSLSQVIKEKINAGASWITFFGHSATGAFDFSIDEPENYTNLGKYPIILSNGCFAGFIHDASVGYSERFVLGPDRGAIAFMATSNLSVPGALNNFSSRLYKNVSVNTYNQPLGMSIRETITDLMQFNNVNDYDKEVAYEMTLHGDPGLKPNQYPKPDFAIDAASVYTTPQEITPGTDEFDLNVIITNLGRSAVNTDAQNVVTQKPITVTLKRTVFDANNNPVYYYYSKDVPSPYYKDTVTFTIPVSISTLGYGQNLFEPYVDAGFAVEEMGECNNGLSTPFTTYIQNDDVIPIYPYEFAIVPEKGVTLKASTINPFATLRGYRFQIDTTELFNSAKLRETVVTQVGGVVRWKTDSTYYVTDSTVYYWRVRKDTTGATWHTSSFVHIQGEDPGWNQSHYYQYLKDDYQNINYGTDRVFRYPPTTNTIHVNTGLVTFQGGPVDFSNLGWDYNNYNQYRYRMGRCDGPNDQGNGYTRGLTFAVINSESGAPWFSRNFNGDDFGDDYGNIHCSKHSNNQYGFDFLTTGMRPDTNISWSQTIANFIDAVPAGHYILVYSVNQVPYTSWDNTLVQALGSIGFASQPFTSGAINGPFVYFVQKGNQSNPFVASQNGYGTALDVDIN